MSVSFNLRQKRKLRQRYKIRHMSSGGKTKKLRLCVHRSNNHIYAQVIDDGLGKTIVCSSTLTKEVKAKFAGSCGSKDAAAYVGMEIAKKALEKGIESVVFDRSGFLYHGRVKSLAEAARQNGLLF